MREILFKAKSTYNGKWVEGCLIHFNDYYAILQNENAIHPMDIPYLDRELGTFDGKATPIYPETICEYTGITDKQGNKLFEGDIFVFDNATDFKIYMNFEDAAWIGKALDKSDKFKQYRVILGEENIKSIEIVGNIHDKYKGAVQ